MKLALARIKALEPLMLRGAGEFDPSSRGVYSYAASRHLPTPSTMIGALISNLHPSSATVKPGSWRELLELYSKALDELGIEALRGFYVYCGGKLYVPLTLGKRFMLTDSEALRLLKPELLDSLISCIEKGRCSRETVEGLRSVEDSVKDRVLKPVISERVGIALESRVDETPSKTVREGYIYTARYISYPDPTAEIRFALLLKNTSRETISLGKEIPVKLGGEQRIAKLRVDADSDQIIRGLEELARRDHKYLLLTTPAPFREEHLNKTPKHIGKIDVIGLGYSLAARKRKPLYPALMEGSIVKVDRTITEETLKYGIYSLLGLHQDEEYKILSRIGYGTVIPLTTP